MSLHDEYDEHDELVVTDENEMSVTLNEVIVDVHKSKEPLKDSNVTSPKPYNPHLPFSQRMANAKLDCNLRSSWKFLRSST